MRNTGVEVSNPDTNVLSVIAYRRYSIRSKVRLWVNVVWEEGLLFDETDRISPTSKEASFWIASLVWTWGRLL